MTLLYDGIGTDWVIVPIPLRPGLTVRVQIPCDLGRKEAEKVARVIAALSVG